MKTIYIDIDCTKNYYLRNTDIFSLFSFIYVVFLQTYAFTITVFSGFCIKYMRIRIQIEVVTASKPKISKLRLFSVFLQLCISFILDLDLYPEAQKYLDPKPCVLVLSMCLKNVIGKMLFENFLHKSHANLSILGQRTSFTEI